MREDDHLIIPEDEEVFFWFAIILPYWFF